MYNKRALNVDLGKFTKPDPYKDDILYTEQGQWEFPGQPTRIPSNDITMEGVPYPVYGIDNTGYEQMMYPGEDYTFPGDYVDEYPMAKRGGYMQSLPKKKSSKRYSRSLTATNKLFTKNPFFKNTRSKKNRVFDPNAKYYQDGGAFDDDINKRRQVLRDWTYGKSIGMLQEPDGGYIELDLSEEEIDQYRQGGYIIEDISVPMLTKAEYGMPMGTGMSQNYMGNTRTFYQTGGRTLPKPRAKNYDPLYTIEPQVAESTAVRNLPKQDKKVVEKAIAKKEAERKVVAQKIQANPLLTQAQKDKILLDSRKLDENVNLAYEKGPDTVQQSVNQSLQSRFKDIILNPDAAIYYGVSGKDMPKNYQAMIEAGINPMANETGGNSVLRALNTLNPLVAVNDIKKATGEGNYNEAGLGLLGFIPGFKQAKTIGRAKDIVDDAKNIEKTIDFTGPLSHSFTNRDDVINALGQRGKNWDDVGATGKDLLHSDMINYHGTFGGRPIVEVKMPDGSSEMFYKSTGWGGKAGNSTDNTTQGMWQVYGGHAPDYNDWFIKGPQYKDYYGSNTFKNMAENLDDALAKKYGFNSANELDDAFNFKNKFGKVDSYTPSRPLKTNSPIRSGLGGMDMSRYEIANPDYFTQLLDTYTSRQLPPSSKKFYKGLIASIKKQDGIVTERQYQELQRLKTGNFNYGKKAYQEGGYIELELTPEEIQNYIAQGYEVEDLEEAQDGLVIEGKTNYLIKNEPPLKKEVPVKKQPVKPLVIPEKINFVPQEIREKLNTATSSAPVQNENFDYRQALNKFVPGEFTPKEKIVPRPLPRFMEESLKNPIGVTPEEEDPSENFALDALSYIGDGVSSLWDAAGEKLNILQEQGNRFLEKQGLIDTQDNKIDFDKVKSKKPPVTKATSKPAKFYQELAAVPDSYSPENKLLSYRNQWDNSEGFEYIATPVKKDRTGNEQYKNVKGVGHFLLDASVADNKVYKWKDNDSFLRKAKENNDWIPAFQRVEGDRVKLQYKKPDELTKSDMVVTPLRQMDFDNINFNKTQRPEGFKKGINEVTTKDGKGTYLLFKDRDGYSRFSGGSVVFIFKDEYGNTIVRDFAGSLNGIKNEGQEIKKEYKLKPNELTIGYHDVGSYSAKPKANKYGILKSSQWEGYNTAEPTGGALLIPKD